MSCDCTSRPDEMIEFEKTAHFECMVIVILSEAVVWFVVFAMVSLNSVVRLTSITI